MTFFQFVTLALRWFNDSPSASHSVLRLHSAGDDSPSAPHSALRVPRFAGDNSPSAPHLATTRWIMLFIYSNLHSFNSIAFPHYMLSRSQIQ